MNMGQKDPHKVFQDLLGRHLAGELSKAEEESFREALREDASLEKELEEYRKIWDSVDDLARSGKLDMDEEWEQMQGMLPGFQKETHSPSMVHPGRRLGAIILRIAAVLLVGLFLGVGGYYALNPVKVVKAASQQEEVLLPDGSLVVLNRHSRLSYRKKFNQTQRQVRLAGEAWFDVTRDSSRRFTVDAGQARVEVLGTSFNVNAYKDNPKVEITVQSGVVALSSMEKQAEQIVLRAGNSGSYDTQKKELVLLPGQDTNALSWRTGEIFFDHTPMREVARTIARIYDVVVEIPDQDLASCPITVTFRDQDLEAVLEVLAVTLDLEIEGTGGRFILRGEGCEEE
jgi:ferric-dicitrate binding protein FerR (iron transport regulator)